jgi:hypothetical protein
MRTWLAFSSAAALLAAPIAAADEQTVYSEAQVSAFVDLLLTAAEIENERVAGIEAAESRAEAERIHYTQEARLVQVIEGSGMPLELYDEMVVRARTDLRLGMQIYDELESRGEVALLPEPEGAFPTEATEPAYTSYADDPLF